MQSGMIPLYKSMIRRLMRYFSFSAALLINVWLTGWIGPVLLITYLWYTCPELDGEYLTSLAACLGLMALVHGYFFDLFSGIGIPSPLKAIRYTNSIFTGRYATRRSSGTAWGLTRLQDASRLELLYRLLFWLPGLNVRFVIFSSFSTFLMSGIIYYWQDYSGLRFWQIISGGFLGTYIGSFLAYVSSDLFLGEYRQRLLRRTAALGLELPRSHGISLRFLSINLAAVLLSSMLLAFLTLYQGLQQARPMWANILFVSTLALTGLLLAFFLYRSLYLGLMNLSQGAERMFRTSGRWYFTKSSNREITNVASSYYQAFRKIHSYNDDLMEQVARQTLVLQDKQDEIDSELLLAAEIQKGILKEPQLKNWSHVEIAVHYRPLYKVSGDFYSFYPVDFTQLGFVLGDASGHGVPAALLTMMSHFAFSQGYHEYAGLQYILDYVNRVLLEHTPESAHLSAFTFLLDRFGQLDYCNAGHLPALLYRFRKNSFELLNTEGFLLGLLEESSFSHSMGRTNMQPGDFLVLFTDGITERTNPAGEPLGLAGLIRLLEQAMNVEEADSLLGSEFIKELDLVIPGSLTGFEFNPQHGIDYLRDCLVASLAQFSNPSGQAGQSRKMEGSRDDDETILIMRTGR
jgi:hypothetical protein